MRGLRASDDRYLESCKGSTRFVKVVRVVELKKTWRFNVVGVRRGRDIRAEQLPGSKPSGSGVSTWLSCLFTILAGVLYWICTYSRGSVATCFFGFTFSFLI